MSKILARGLLILVVVFGILEVTAALFPFRKAPLRLHDWWIFPVACVEVRCVTYRQWGTVVRRSDSSPENAPEVLTRLLTSKAAALVARRSGLSVSNEEIDAALRTLRTTTASEPSIEQFLKARAVDVRSKEFRGAMHDFLLHSKLAAAGITDVWVHPTAPSVRVLHAWYRWNVSTHTVELR